MLFPEQTPIATEAHSGYSVFSRKYRPQNFAELIGQPDLVKTLTHALEAERVGHAYLFSGVRGVGKTTVARILAKSLNCKGADGENTAPVIASCGVCDACVGIAESRHIDVLEMDAASQTGIDNIREIIDSLKYKPVRARYKIIIMDETHMLSKAAFNGLLKTLEEPPPHVKFIFATTEIQKIPVTVLSRCQVLDLKKINAKDLHFCLRNVCEREKIAFESEALTLLVRAAAGSARDALSLLDRAVSGGSGAVLSDDIRGMLGGSDETALADVFENILSGDTAAALKRVGVLFAGGADAILFLKDLLRRTETLARLKHTGEPGEHEAITDEELEICKKQAQAFETPKLSRFWSVLIEALSVSQTAPDASAVCEMAIIRMSFGINAPDPIAILKQGFVLNPSAAATPVSGALAEAVDLQTATDPTSPQPAKIAPDLSSFEKLLSFLDEKRESLLKNRLEYDIRVSEYSDGVIRYSPATEKIDPRFVMETQNKLRTLTGKNWLISLADTGAEAGVSVAEKKRAFRSALKEKIEAHPFMQKIKDHFPGSIIEDVRHVAPVSFSSDDPGADEENRIDRE